MKRWTTAAGVAVTVAALLGAAGTDPPSARADDVGYLVNVTVNPGYHFADAQAALDYGHGLCERIRMGQSYADLATSIRSDFDTSDEYLVSYLLSQATQELCPAQIWQLTQSAVGYRPPEG